MPKLHAIAVAVALLPSLSEWAVGLIDNALSAAGTSATEVGDKALGQAGVVYEGLKMFGSGAVLAGLMLGTIVTFVLDKRFIAAAAAGGVAAALSWVGLIHSHEVGWAANPQVALGYLFFGLVCLAYSRLLPGTKRSDEPQPVGESGE